MKKLLILLFVITLFSVSTGKSNQNDIMGDIIDAKCDCGFKTEMFLGGGKMNFEKYCGFPFYCKDCKSLFMENYLNEKHICKNCSSSNVLPYDDDSMREHFSDKSIFGWDVKGKIYTLTDDNYLCPKCQKFKLKFYQVGNWD